MGVVLAVLVGLRLPCGGLMRNKGYPDRQDYYCLTYYQEGKGIRCRDIGWCDGECRCRKGEASEARSDYVHGRNPDCHCID